MVLFGVNGWDLDVSVHFDARDLSRDIMGIPGNIAAGDMFQERRATRLIPWRRSRWEQLQKIPNPKSQRPDFSAFLVSSYIEICLISKINIMLILHSNMD